jgi:hypothetical protein
MAKITLEIDDSLVQSFANYIARNYPNPMTLQEFVLYQMEQLTNEVVKQFPPDTVTDELQQIEVLRVQIRDKLRPFVVPEEPASPEPIRPALARKRV